MALTDMTIRKAKLPEGKKQMKMADGGGLYLLINKSGKYWRYDFKINEKRKTLAIGTYPDIPLAGKADKANHDEHGHPLYIKGARDLRDEAKALVKMGIDPVLKRKAEIAANKEKQVVEKKQQVADASTFEVVGRQWFNTHKSEWVESHAKRQIGRLERHLFPSIGDIPLAQLTKAQVANALKQIAERGTHDIAHRMAQITRSILNYACDSGLIDAVPMGDMKSVLPAPVSTKMPAIVEPKRIGEMMRAIHNYSGTFVVCQALKLLPLLAVRSGEFRAAEWSEFNLDDALWTIPASHRKLRKALKENSDNVHLVPLSRQAVAILKELHQLTGKGRHVFPSARGDARPMSENAINVAIHAMGFKGEMVGHGVRTMFSSSLNEQGFNPDAIERQLAHAEKNAVRAAYNRSEYMEERKKMMQHWADYLDGLRTGADVIPINRRA